MSSLWSPVVATGGNQRQIDRAPKPQKQAKSVAIGCDRLLETFHRKEGVDGSSPSEGSKIPAKRGFLLSRLVQPSTSFARRASMIGGSYRVAERGLNKPVFGASTPAKEKLAIRGQILGTQRARTRNMR